jgi:hypothetical protein
MMNKKTLIMSRGEKTLTSKEPGPKTGGPLQDGLNRGAQSSDGSRWVHGCSIINPPEPQVARWTQNPKKSSIFF